MTREQILSEIEEFVARVQRDGGKMTETTFGRFAVNDGKLVARLRDGGGLTLDTAEKIRAFIRNYDSGSASATGAGLAAAPIGK